MNEKKIKTIQTSYGEVEYLDWGEGPVILSLHGAMGGYDQADILARTIGPLGYRYICPSRPGYLGTAIDAGVSPSEQATLYAELLDFLEIKNAIVMAISGGGPSAMHFAIEHKERCNGLILVSTVGGPAPNKIPLMFYIMTTLAKWSWAVKLLKNSTEKNLKKSLAASISDPEILEKTLNNKDVMPLFKELTLSSFHKMAERITGTKNDIRITGSYSYPLDQIKVPTLIIHGSHDPLVPLKDHGQKLADEIEGAEILIAEKGEHVTIFTHREMVQARVKDFLKKF